MGGRDEEEAQGGREGARKNKYGKGEDKQARARALIKAKRTKARQILTCKVANTKYVRG